MNCRQIMRRKSEHARWRSTHRNFALAMVKNLFANWGWKAEHYHRLELRNTLDPIESQENVKIYLVADDGVGVEMFYEGPIKMRQEFV